MLRVLLLPAAYWSAMPWRIITRAGDMVRRRRTPPVEARIWHCAESNKIFVLENELTLANEHVAADVLDSLNCH